jgi:hypothetical protein
MAVFFVTAPVASAERLACMKLLVSVTFDPTRGYVASHPELSMRRSTGREPP